MIQLGAMDDEGKAKSMLAEARHEYATVEALDRTTPDDAPERQAVEARKAVLGERVFALDVQHRLVTSGGAVDAEHVTPEEQTAAHRRRSDAARPAPTSDRGGPGLHPPRPRAVRRAAGPLALAAGR